MGLGWPYRSLGTHCGTKRSERVDASALGPYAAVPLLASTACRYRREQQNTGAAVDAPARVRSSAFASAGLQLCWTESQTNLRRPQGHARAERVLAEGEWRYLCVGMMAVAGLWKTNRARAARPQNPERFRPPLLAALEPFGRVCILRPEDIRDCTNTAIAESRAGKGGRAAHPAYPGTPLERYD